MISNSELTENLIDIGVLSTKNIIEAFQNVDRADFVRDSTAPDIYEDYPLQIGHGQTISQPRTVAMMMEMLSPKEGEKILDIGSGSGWTTALLAFIVGESGSVTGVERVRELVKFGNSNLAKYNFSNAKIIQARAKLGIVGEEFDRILVSAAADEFPYELTAQLKIGGKLVIPVRDSVYEIRKNESGKLEAREHYGFSFVPLIF
ncbi:MAG: protein-L-isoaspartate O-methyltransferase [Sulfurimonas sp.]|nr:protein-L-isoaspartate O-methyltransferase [Sulfurimonas sp.]